jgi:hypothetical protein
MVCNNVKRISKKVSGTGCFAPNEERGGDFREVAIDSILINVEMYVPLSLNK